MDHKSNLTRFILASTQKYGALPAFIVKDDKGQRRPVSYQQFNDHVVKLSQVLRAKFPKGDFKVGLWGENQMEWCALALAIWHAGGTLVPLMHIATDSEIRNIIGAAKLNCLFISPRISQKRDFEVPEIYSLEFKSSSTPDLPKTAGDLLRTPLTHLPASLKHGSRTHSDDMAVLIFTSGTTGHPKGVMLSHANLIADIIDTLPLVPGGQGHKTVSVLPLSHMFELVAGFAIAHIKGICISYPDSLKPDDVLGELRHQKANMMIAVPLFFEIIDRAINEKLKTLHPLILKLLTWAKPLVRRYPRLGPVIFRRVHQIFGGHLDFFVTGGARIDPEVIFRFQSLGLPLIQGYGLTETSPIISLTTLDQPQKFASVGRPLPSLKIKIEDPNEFGEGEICVQGPTVFNGYFENPEATAQVIKNGWFHTGDVGKIDSDSFIYITGRAKDIIVTANGKNVYPDELEDLLKNSPLFKEIAVIGIESGHGETVHAVVVPQTSRLQNSQELKKLVTQEIERLSAGISDYKRIQGVTLSFGELPKTATKKVKKHLLKQMIKEGKFESQKIGQESGTVQTPLALDASKEGWLSRELTTISKQTLIFKEASLRHDLGIDSLTFMELVGHLESHFGIQIPDESFGNIHTVNDLLEFLDTAQPGETKNLSQQIKFDYKKNTTIAMKTLRLMVHVFLIRPFLKIYFRARSFNSEILKSENGFVITPNHSSHLDLPMVMGAIPLRLLNRTFAVAADDYFFNTRFKAFFVRLVFNGIPFERKARIEKGFKVCEEILRDGGNLVIFPEGTRSLAGRLSDFKPGVGRLVASHPYLVIPALIVGAHGALPKGSKIPKPTSLQIRFGSPLKFSSLKSSLDDYQQVALASQKAVMNLLTV